MEPSILQHSIPSFNQMFPSEYLHESHILNLIPEALYICDMCGVILKYNEQAVQLWGRRPAIGDVNERFNGAWKLYYSNGTIMPHDQTPAAACLKDGLPRKDEEIIIERPDHSRIHVHMNIMPILDNTGAQIGTINCFYDITEKKKTEQALQRKSLELNDYVENASIGLHWVDEHGIIKWANKAELDMLGYDKTEYVGHPITEFHVNNWKIEEILNKLSCNETLNQYESELRCKNGSIKTVHISSNVFWEDEKFVHTRCFTIDVTEQKKLAQAVKDSEARYKSLVNSLPVAVYSCNKEGNITFFNEVAVELWGYRPDTTDKTLKYCACYKVLVNGKYIPPNETPMATALQTGRSFRNIEAYVERPDGSGFYACMNIDPIIDDNNNVIGAINAFQDVSNFKRVEAALRNSEAKYRQLIHTLDTPLYTTDLDGRITMYNKAAVDLWGREPEIGKDLWCGSFKILNTDSSDMPLDTCPMAVCLKERRPVHGEEILVVRPDGSIRNVAPHPQPIFDDSGNMTGAINMLVDITRIKRTEKELRESEANYRILADSLEKEVERKVQDLKKKTEDLIKFEERYHKMVDEVEDYVIIMLDQDGIIQNWNKGAEKIKGYKEEEIVGKSFQEFYLQEDRAKRLPSILLNEAKETGKAIHEGWRKRKDGSLFWGNTVLTALHNLEGNVIGFSKVTRDLTERKLREDKMKEYLQQLEFQNKELEQFVYAASHDMKEPLRKINIYNNFIAEDEFSQLSTKSRDYLNRSINAVDRMKKLIENLLTYSRTTSCIENYKSVDLNNVVKEIAHIHREELERSNGTIEFDNLPILKAVPFQINQLMFNLIENSIKYRHPDRVIHIRVKGEIITGRELKEHKVDAGSQFHKISVIDNGAGFDPQYAQRIFEIFQQLENVANVGGSGIGLAICKKIVQNHGGYMYATGKPNEGSIFTIYFPVLN